MTESSAAYSLAGTDKLAGKPLLLLFMGLFAYGCRAGFCLCNHAATRSLSRSR
jgi:hypothetical protein